MIDGNRHGPYSPDEVRQYLSSGQLQPQMQVWGEGMTDWQPLETIMSSSPALPRRILTIISLILALALEPFCFEDDLHTRMTWRYWAMVSCAILAGIVVLVVGRSRWRWLLLILLLPGAFFVFLQVAGYCFAVASLAILAGMTVLVAWRSRRRWLFLLLIVPCACFCYYKITEVIAFLHHGVRP